MFKNNSIVTKLYLIFICVAFIPTFGITFASYQNAKKTILKEIIDSIDAINKLKAMNVQHLIHLRQEQARELAGTYIVRQLKSDRKNDPKIIEEIQQQIDSIEKRLNKKHNNGNKETAIEIIGIWDIDGIIIANTDRELIGQKMPPQYFENVKKYGSFFVGIEIDPLTGRKYQIILEEIRGWNTEELVGVVLLKIKSDILNEIIDTSAHSWNTVESYIINQDFKMITQSRYVENSVLNIQLSRENFQKSFEEPELFLRYANYRGVKVLAFSRKIAMTDWVIVTEVEELDAILPLVQFRNQLFMIALIFLMFVGFLARKISRSIIKPVLEIKDIAQKVSQGNLDVKVEASSNDEIGDLISSFNIMIKKLKRSGHEIQNIKIGLDQHSIVAIVNVKGNITYANDKFLEISKYSMEELLGKNMKIVSSHYHSNEFYKEMWEKISQGNVWRGEFCNKNKENQFYWVESTIVPIMDEQGIPVEYVAIQTEITEWKTAEERKKKNDAIMRLLQHTAELANASKDSEKTLKEILKEVCNFMCWPIGHVYFIENDIAKPSKIWYTDLSNDFSVFQEVTERTSFRKGEGLPGRVLQNRKSAWIVDVTVDPNYPRNKLAKNLGVKAGLGFPVSIRNEIVAVIEVYSINAEEPESTVLELLNNVGEQLGLLMERERAAQKLQEEQIKANIMSRKAQQAAVAKSNFLANMSHEIRTPMNAILGFSELLMQTELNDKQEKYLKTVQSSGKLLLSLINDILDFSKFEAGKIQLEFINFNMEYLLDDVFKMITPNIKNKSIETYIDIDKDAKLNVKGDPTRIRQILINLLSNAVKFTSEGAIGIILRMKKEKSVKGYVCFQICVSDTGLGVPEEKRQTIFEAFQQADDSTTRKFGGTGLGLAICKSLIEVMQGTIWVESQEGKGSQFVFEITLKEGDSSLEEDSREEDVIDISDKVILAVDDNEQSRNLIEEYLKQSGLKEKNIRVCPSARSGLEVLDGLIKKKSLPDIIISDIMMPGMDGYEFINRVRSNKETKSIKAIAITSDIRLGTARSAQESGFDGFLAKPITRTELLKVISFVLSEKSKSESIVTRHTVNEVSYKRKIKILVVEDSIPNQELIKAYFSDTTFEADYANNGKEAVAKVRGGQYDICFMDLQMPEMSGDEATKIIRKEITKQLPIIALTAAVLEEDKKLCLEAGMNDFLTKPVSAQKLKDKIYQYVKNSSE